LEVTLLNRQRAQPVDRERLLAFFRRLIREAPPAAADRLGIALVTDRRMRQANRRFRGRNASTDVLSFPGDPEPDPEGGRHLGDILISVDRAREQADEADVALERELCSLLIHGYLHLLGYDHERDDGTMMRLQQRLESGLLDAQEETEARG